LDQAPLVLGERTVVTLHDNPCVALETDLYDLPLRMKITGRSHLKLFSKKCTAHVMSHYVERGLREYGYEGPIHVFPFPLDPSFRPLDDREQLRARLGLPRDRSLVLSVSTAAKRKNLQIVSEVMDQLGSEYHLVRVGSSVGYGTTIPFVDSEMLNQIYNACDAFLLPSLEEGFGVPVIEAFAAGLPVVASAIPSIQESAHGVALLFEPSDARGMAAGVKDAIANRETLAKLGTLRASDYSLPRFADRLLAFYRVVGAGS
jgi:glycosyltransferase involved in cell wall biosynthesis